MPGGLCFGILVMFCMPGATSPTTVVCPPIIEVPAAMQKRVASELRAMPKDAALREYVARSIEQRDVNRACLKAKTKAK